MRREVIKIELFKLVGRILVDSDDAEQSLQRTDNHAEKVGGTLGKSIGTAVKWGIGITTAVTGVGAGLFAMASKASEAGAEIDDIAQRTNLSAKTLQEFKHAAEMSGIGIETIEGSAKKLTITMGKYADGNKGTVSAFKELGLSAEGTNGKLKSTDEMFPQIIAKLADMKDITERNNLAVKIFGKSAMDMAPMLNGGSAGVKQLTDEAHKMGLVMSDESVQAGAKFDDTLTVVKASLGALVTKIGVEVLPIAQKMMEWVSDHMPEIQAVTSKVFDVIGVAVQAVGKFISNVLVPAFQALWDWIEPNIPAIKKLIEDAFNTIKDLTESVIKIIKTIWEKYGEEIKTIITSIFEVIKVIVTTAMKVIKDIINIATALMNGDWKKVWEGIKTLFSDVWNGIGKIIDKYIDYIKSVLSLFGKVIGDILSDAWNGVKSVTSSVWNAIKTAIETPIKSARDTVKGVIDAILGFFTNLHLPEIKIPNIKLPHFSINGSFSLDPPSIPHLGVEWYDKGGIFNSPSIIGVGEKRPEFVGALDDLKSIVREAMGSSSGSGNIYVSINADSLQKVTDIVNLFENLRQTQNAY